MELMLMLISFFTPTPAAVVHNAQSAAVTPAITGPRGCTHCWPPPPCPSCQQ